jgi:hypothetical protein
MLFVAANASADIHARSIFFCSFLSSETTVSSKRGMVIMQTKDQYQKGISKSGYSLHTTIYITTHMTAARQRLVKHVPEVTLSTTE